MKDTLRLDEEPPTKRAKTCSHDDKPAIPDNSLGQLGANLLLYYPSSVSEDNILGLIVEQTHVSFKCLRCTYIYMFLCDNM